MRLLITKKFQNSISLILLQLIVPSKWTKIGRPQFWSRKRLTPPSLKWRYLKNYLFGNAKISDLFISNTATQLVKKLLKSEIQVLGPHWKLGDLTWNDLIFLGQTMWFRMSKTPFLSGIALLARYKIRSNS